MNIDSENLIEMEFLKIADDTKYWFVRSGKGAEYYKDFKTNNYIAIGDNEITLEELNNIEDKHKEIEDTFLSEYKRIFNNKYIEILKETAKYKNSDLTEQNELLEKEKRSSTIAANKAFKFVEQMDIGDYVLVPYKSSEYFLLGIILSDTYDEDINHIYLGIDDDYTISDYQKKRTVLWIKEVPFKDLPDQLNWILQGNRAIFNISEHAEYINPLISNQYIYKDKVYLRINVGTSNKIDSKTWLYYQSTIVKNSNDKAEEIFQKNKVQSEGQTIIEAIQNNWETIASIAVALFTDADVNIYGSKFKWRGPLAFLIPSTKRKRERDDRLDDLEVAQAEENLEQTRLTNQRMRIENDKIKNKPQLYQTGEKTSSLTYEVKKAPEEQEALNNMEISEKSIGRAIPIERQMDNLFDFDEE